MRSRRVVDILRRYRTPVSDATARGVMDRSAALAREPFDECVVSKYVLRVAEKDELIRKCSEIGWSLEIDGKDWVLRDPAGEGLKSKFPPFVKGFIYGYLRCREERLQK